MSKNKGIALVTGASAGIGAIYADRLAKRGHDLILIARSEEKLRATADRIAHESGRAVATIVADLEKADDLRKIEAILREDDRISVLVNNAGVGATGSILESDIDKMARLITLNVQALTRLTYAVAPRFVARKGGTIINIASIVAIGPEILNGVYGASKAYVLALSQSLRHELGEKGVRIQAVLPGATATDFWSAAGTPLEHLPQEIVMPAEAMVDAALAGLDLGEFITIPSLPDASQWDVYDAARQAMLPNLSRVQPAERYTA